jgi:Ca-activated chloride channel family protein
MWRFEHISHLWWLILLPVIAGLWYYLDKKLEEKLSQTGNPARIKSLLSHYSAGDRNRNRTLYILSLFFLIIAYANPQVGDEEATVRSKGADVVIALDLSNSMMANDISPNRLERSKKFLSELAGKMAGDRVALIVFAGEAYLQMPFTTDYGALEMYLNSLSTDLLPTQGTAIGQAIIQAFKMPGVLNNAKGKVLLILSDGEDHDSEALANAKKVGKEGMTILTIGVGTKEGSKIPEINDFGTKDFKRDRSGNEVVSRLNEPMLKQLAEAAGGTYHNIQEGKKAQKEILRTIQLSANNAAEERNYRDYKSFFQIPLAIAMVLLLLEWIYYPGMFKDFKKNKSLLIIPVLFLLASCDAFKQTPGYEANEKGLEAYQKSEFKKAINYFSEAVRNDSLSAAYVFNLANSFYKAGEKDTAAKLWEKSIELASADSILKASALFNSGNFQRTQFQPEKAIESYKQSLRLNAGRYRVQHNLSMLLKNQPKDQQQENKDKDQNKEDQKDQPKDHKDKDKSEKEKEGKDKEQNKKENKKDEKNDKGKPKPDAGQEDKKNEKQQKSNLNPEQVARIMQALNQQEKAVQRKIYEKSSEASGKEYVDKDW